MTRFLCTGDSHIGKGIGLYPERLAEQQQVWADTLELARELDVDAVLHAGDLFDQRRPGPDVMLAAERPLVEHSAEDGCPVLVVAGNHDVPSQDGPCGLDVLAEAGLVRLARTPEGWTLGGIGSREWCGVATLPWTPIGRLLANADPADRSETHALAADLLVESARELRSQTDGTMVLLAHWSVSGSALPNGTAVAQVSETVLPLERLQQIGFDAIVLGHIHRPQHLLVADERDRPTFYVGSPMPLDHGEASCEHGVWVLEVGKGATFHPLPSRRFVTLNYGDEPPDVKGAIVRAVFKLPAGANPPDVASVREVLLADGAHVVTGVHVEVEREERQRAAVAEDITPEEALAAWLEHRGINGQVGADVTARARLYLEGASA